MRGHVLITWYFNFNPRSHERSDGEHVRDRRGEISIHAPTRGATYDEFIPESMAKFQSTLPREERQIPHRSTVRAVIDFNPRSHERSDDFEVLR